MKNKDNLLRYQYSWILVPLFTLLYILYPNLRIYLQYLMFVTGWVGIIVARMIKLPLHLFLLSTLGHLPVFIGLFYKESFFQFNYTQIIFFQNNSQYFVKYHLGNNHHRTVSAHG